MNDCMITLYKTVGIPHLWPDPSVCLVLSSQLVYSGVGVEVHNHGSLPRLVVYRRAPYHVHQVVKGIMYINLFARKQQNSYY